MLKKVLAILAGLLLIIWADNCFAANYYVRTDGNDSTCNGTVNNTPVSAPNCAWATLQKAINPTGGIPTTAAPGNNLFVKTGSYGGTNLNVTTRGNTDVLVVEGFNASPGDGHSADLGANKPTIATTDASDCIYNGFGTAPTSGAFTLRNFQFNPPNFAGGSYIHWGTSTGANSPNVDLTLDYLTIANSVATLGIVDSREPTVLTRDFRITNSSFQGASGRPGLVLIGVRDAFVTGNTIIAPQVSASNIAIDIEGSSRDVVVSNNLITGYYTLDVHNVTSGRNIKVASNTITAAGQSLTIASFYSGVWVTDNTITAPWNNVGVYVVQLGKPPTPLIEWTPNQIKNVYFLRNIITKTGVRNGGDHLWYVAPGVVGGEVAYNVGYDATGGSYGYVHKGEQFSIHHNAVTCSIPLYLLSASHNRISNNSFYSNYVNGVGFAIGTTASGTIRPYDNIITNNIISGGLGTTAFTNILGAFVNGFSDSITTPTFVYNASWTDASKTLTATGAFTNYTFVTGDHIRITGGTSTVVQGLYTIASRTSNDAIVLADDINGATGNDTSVSAVIDNQRGQNYVDYNIYYPGTVGLFALGDGSSVVSGSILSEMQTQWGAISPVFLGINDQHSVLGDPTFLDPSTGNLKIQSFSPAKGVKLLTTLLGDWNDKGAWQSLGSHPKKPDINWTK